MSLMKLPTRPTTLAQTGRRLAGAQTGIGAHQKAALAYAIQTGFYLHIAQTMCKHGEWGPWLEEHFDGSADRAQKYAKIARGYAASPLHFTGCEDIESALKIARTLPKPDGLPAWLPDLLVPPEPAAQPVPGQKALPPGEAPAAQRAFPRAERERHPVTRAGEAARKAEALLREAMSSAYPDERLAFLDESAAIVKEHALFVAVNTE